ncbi:CpaF family protein [Pelagibius sp. Alg239-R121]|uniref:CpaF family protein n=1 Tax=Pelagibius sp. Alg239-R121 TaxID=2993448 RepID=UPI0024A71653|nr:ATPase, T2SS/T4P/T4SS family [Pelagibius sp. Alg239-R121]
MTDLLTHYSDPIAVYLEDPDVTDILVNRFDEIWIEKNGELSKTTSQWRDEMELESFIDIIANSLGQDADEAGKQILDARLPNGTRVNAVLPPIAVKGRCLSIRPFPKRKFTMDDLLERRMLADAECDILQKAVLDRKNILVAGGTGSGKTTVLRAVCSFIDPAERVITVEDTAEGLVDRPHVVSFEAAKRLGGDHGDTVTMGRLIENALRQRPDRIIVGEVRSPEAATALVDAINTGHAGCISTIHANSASDALVRLETLYARHAPNLSLELIRRLICSNVDLLIHVKREIKGFRKVREIVEVDEDGNLH